MRAQFSFYTIHHFPHTCKGVFLSNMNRRQILPIIFSRLTLPKTFRMGYNEKCRYKKKIISWQRASCRENRLYSGTSTLSQKGVSR